MTIPAGVRFAPVTPELLAASGATLSDLRVWAHVWLQTLGRPSWTLSHAQIGAAANISRASAKASVRRLAGLGWLIVEHQRDVAGDASASLIQCAFPPGVGLPLTPPGFTTDPTGGVVHNPRGGVTADPLHKSHQPEEPSVGLALVPSPTSKLVAADKLPPALCEPVWFISDRKAEAMRGYFTRDDELNPREMGAVVARQDADCWWELWDCVTSALAPAEQDAYAEDCTPSRDWYRLNWSICVQVLDAYEAEHPWIDLSTAAHEQGSVA